MRRAGYRYLLAAFSISTLGDWLSLIAIPVSILNITGSALAMASAYALTSLPFIVSTPIGGVLADRVSRRAMLMYGDLGAALLTGVLATIVAAAPDHTVWLYILIFAIALISGIYHSAFDTIVKDIVDPDDLMKANAGVQSAANLVGFMGPVVAGALTAIIGAADAIYLDAASFAASFVLVSRLPHGRPARVGSVKLGIGVLVQDLKDGASHAWSNPLIRHSSVLLLCYNFAYNLFYANLMFFLLHTLRLKPAEVGGVLAVSGAAAILGAMAAPPLCKHLPAGYAILIAAKCTGLCILLMLTADGSVTIGLLWGLATAFNAAIVVIYFTLRQQVAEDAYLGRIIAITRVANFAAVPLAAVLGGWLLDSAGHIEYVILLSAAMMATGACYGWLTPLAQIGQSRGLGRG